jgi:hypothetical protein
MKSSNKTKVFREAVGVFFILSIVLVIGYYFYLNKKYSKENTSISEQTKISMNGVNDIIPTPRMIPELNWNNDFISVKSDGIRYHFRLIIDGKAYYDPINIMTKDGEILAESKLYLNGYYKDKENKLRNVKLPIIIKMQNGKSFNLVNVRTLENEDVENKIENLVDSFTSHGILGTPGVSIFVLLAPDLSLIREIIPEEERGWVYYTDLYEKFYRSWSGETDTFYETGIPFLDYVLPNQIALGAPEPIDNFDEFIKE